MRSRNTFASTSQARSRLRNAKRQPKRLFTNFAGKKPALRRGGVSLDAESE
jgi:hypothetical protein